MGYDRFDILSFVNHITGKCRGKGMQWIVLITFQLVGKYGNSTGIHAATQSTSNGHITTQVQANALSKLVYKHLTCFLRIRDCDLDMFGPPVFLRYRRHKRVKGNLEPAARRDRPDIAKETLAG